MFSSAGLIGVAILLAFGGMLAAGLYVFVFGLAGMPGTMLTEVLSRNKQKPSIPILGLLLTAVGQAYASLAFVVLIVRSVRSWVGATTGIGKWILWLVGFCVAIAPALMALKDSTVKWKTRFDGLSPGKIAPHYAATLTAPLTVVAFFAFAFLLSLSALGFGWIPHF